MKDTLPVDLPEVAGVHFDLLRNKGVTGPIAQRWRREQSHRFADSADDFILWPQFIDVYTDDEDKGDPAMVGAVDELSRSLWDAGRPAVAECDSEDELQWSGGIARLARA